MRESGNVSESVAPIWRCPLILVAILALAAYGLLLSRHVGTYAAGADAAGYFNHARLLTAGNHHATVRALPGLTPNEEGGSLLTPLGFMPATDGNGMVPTYPVGLPLLLAAAAPVFGWGHAGDVVLCVHALLGVLLTYALGRTTGLSRRGAVIGATVVGASPLYLHCALQMLSDLPALVWALGAVLAAWRSREQAAWALAAGAATAMAVLIRPTNALILAPIAVCLGASPRRWLLLAAGGLPGGSFFCLHNLFLYGHILATGYGGGLWPLFGLQWIGVSMRHYARWLPALCTPVVILAAGLPWLARPMSRQAALLGVWILVYAVFYSAYDCTHQEWWYLRFLLPAVPPLVVSGLLVARKIGFGRRWSLRRSPFFVCSLIAILAYSAFWSERLLVLEVGRGSENYTKIAAWLRSNLPGNAVILTMQMSATLTYYTDFTFVRWDFCDADNRPHVLAALRAGRRPFYAVLFPFEIEGALREHLPGPWTRVASLCSDVGIWRYEADDSAALPAAAPSRPDDAPAFRWLLPVDQPASIRHAYLLFNAVAWLVLAGLVWRLVPGHDWRDWLARGGIFFSAGVIGSLRFALTDLIALTLLAAALLALERRRQGWATALLGAAGIGRAAALLALPAFASPPWLARSNLRRTLTVCALFAVSLVGVGWHLGSIRPIPDHLDWPFASFLDKWLDCFAALFQGQSLGLAWIGIFTLFSFTVQAVFFLRNWQDSDPWWRLGIAYAILMVFLDDAMWVGAAGGATRLLLPLSLAFNVFARRCRASLSWLLAGNVVVAAGVLSFFYPPDLLPDMAALRAAGFAQLTGPSSDWVEGGLTPRHARAWSRGSAYLDIEAWPDSSPLLQADFTLRSIVPRTVIIHQGERELWRGAVGRDFTVARFSCLLTNGHARLEMATDAAAEAESAGSDARALAFAVYDPHLTVQGP